MTRSRIVPFVAVALVLALAGPARAGDCPGDTDGNEVVDVTDLVNVVLDWATDGSGHGGDVDGSGFVDVQDLVAVVLGWGDCNPPMCDFITIPNVTISYDGLQTFAPGVSLPVDYVSWGLATLPDAPGAWVLHSDTRLYLSSDDGCNWHPFPETDPTGLYRVNAGPDGYAYAWVDNGSGTGPTAGIYQVRNVPLGSINFTVAFRPAPVSAMHGFGIDPDDPLHVRTANDAGLIHESFDGGQLWTPIGVAASPGGGFLSYVIEFDPNDIDHAIFGRSGEGAFVTFDGGSSWTQSTGLTVDPKRGNNFFSAAIHPYNGMMAMGMGIDLAQTGLPGDPPPPPSNGRHMYYTGDGGLTWTPVGSAGSGGGEPGDGLLIQNGPVIRAHATFAGVFEYLHSVSPAIGGTRIYRYDLGTDTWTEMHAPDLPKVRTFERSRVNPDAIMLGFGL